MKLIGSLTNYCILYLKQAKKTSYHHGLETMVCYDENGCFQSYKAIIIIYVQYLLYQIKLDYLLAVDICLTPVDHAYDA